MARTPRKAKKEAKQTLPAEAPQHQEAATPSADESSPQPENAPASTSSFRIEPPPSSDDLDSDDERDDEDDGDGNVENASGGDSAPAPEAGESPDGEDTDRWAGTMSHEWNEKEDAATQTSPNAPEGEAAPKSKTKTKPKPRITLEEAVEKIPQDALDYIRTKFKTDVSHIRAYAPENSVKNHAAS